MNIGIVTTWFERGAAYVSRQYKEILEQEHQVFIYARAGEDYAIGDSKWDVGDVTWGKRVPYSPPTSIDMRDFHRWLTTRKLDVVLFNEQHSWPPILLCNEMNIITGAYVDYYKEETIPLFECYDFLICNTQRHYSAFEWHPQCWYIPWGTDLKLFQPLTSVKQSDTVRFFHSSGMSPKRKGTDLVLQAFSRLEGTAHLTIHSQRSLQSTIPEMQPIIQKLCEQERLTLIERTVTAPGLYHLGDIYVYPTRLEGIGLTIPEALACGLPAIVPNYPPMNEFVHEKFDNGRLVDVERLCARSDGYYWPQCMVNLDSLHEAMAYYINHKENLVYFKNQARVYAEEHLDWYKNAHPLLQLLRNVQKRIATTSDSVRKQVLAYERKKVPTAYRYRTFFYPAHALYHFASNLVHLVRKGTS